jgi:hypothetical protein
LIIAERIAIHKHTMSTTKASAFLLWHFSRGANIEKCSAHFLAVCSIVHVECDVRFAPLRVTHGQAALCILLLRGFALGSCLQVVSST